MPNDALDTAKKVEQIDHQRDGGAAKAYQELQRAYTEYSNNHSSDETKQFWNQVTAQLQKDGTLPDVSIGWAQFNKDSIDITGNGSLSNAELAQYGKYADTPQNNFEKTFASELQGIIASANTGSDVAAASIVRAGEIDVNGVNDYIAAQSSINESNFQQATFRDSIKPLFEGSKTSLYQILDGADDHGVLDGQISKSDLNRYVEDYQRFVDANGGPQSDGMPYSVKNYEFVQNVLAGNVEGVSPPIYLNSLAIAGGFKPVEVSVASDYQSVVASYNDANRAVDTPAAPQSVAPETAPSDAAPASSAPTDLAAVPAESNPAQSADRPLDPNQSQQFTGIEYGDRGKIDRITYSDGTTTRFGYSDNGNLDSFTNRSGQFYQYDGHKWLSADGSAAPFSAIDLDAKGSITFSFVDGSKGVMDSTGAITTVPRPDSHQASNADNRSDFDKLSASAQESIKNQVIESVISQSQAQPGEGYIKIAARLLGVPDANDSDPRVKRLYQLIQAANENRTLHPGEAAVNVETLQRIAQADPEFAAILLKDRDEAASNYSAQPGSAGSSRLS